MKIARGFLILLLILMAIASVRFPGSFIQARADQTFLPPTMQNWLGTDSLGRDYFWRLILGLRTSFVVAIGATALSFVVGVALGSYSGWKQETVAYSINRFFDIVQGLPSFLFLAVIMQFTDQTAGLITLVLFCGLFHWPSVARLTRAQTFKVKQEPFVEAAQSLGGTTIHILRTHLWPAHYSLWMIWFCFHVPMEILFESTLSFLGFGIRPPQTSLGLLMQEGWKYLDDKPIFLFAPALLSFAVVISFKSSLKAKVETDL